ncbi:MAG: hypothetical protein NTY36_04020 [Deltaproteobacteria bacterium]|nr:hypothetical protein [Deltaproteobacteria bacterium]
MNYSKQHIYFQIAIEYIDKPGPIQERLTNAYNFNLVYIEPEELPENIRQRFKIVRNKLQVTADMSTEEAEAMAVEIKCMARLLEKYLPEDS